VRSNRHFFAGESFSFALSRRPRRQRDPPPAAGRCPSQSFN